jgi:plastocyanin
MDTLTKLAAAAFSLGLAAGCSSGEAPPEVPKTLEALRPDPSRTGTLGGRITIDGPIPANAPIKMSGDPACTAAQTAGATFETFVSDKGGLGNVFVYVKDGLSGYTFDPPATPVTLDQKGCRYSPHVFGVQAGQNVEIVNSDATLHTVHAMGDHNAEFNLSQPIQAQKDTKFFSKPEVMVRFRCNVHSWMSAYAGVLDHPYFAVTSPDGAFEIRSLPAGTYTVEAWHEKLGTQTAKVTVAEHAAAPLSFTFTAQPATP